MISALDIIDRLPFEMQARLEADEFFADIPVIVAEEGNIKQEIARKQAVLTAKSGKRGAAVLVLQVVADDEHSNIQFGPMTLYPVFQVVENLELNRDPQGTGKSARKIARRVRDVMKNAGMKGLIIDMKPDRPCIRPVALSAELGDLVKSYSVHFRCLEYASETQAQVQAPVIQSLEPAPQVALTCATEGAAIYYTTDDSYPSPQNPKAIAYAEPVGLPEGDTTLRVCAYAAGMIASWVERRTITVTASE